MSAHLTQPAAPVVVTTQAAKHIFRAYLAMLIGVVGMSLSAIFVRWADAPAAVNGFYRMLIAITVFSVPFGLEVRRQPLSSGRAVWFAVLAGVCFAGDLAFWNTAVMLTSAANATFLANTAPLWVGLGAMLFFKQRVRPFFWIGLLVALSGAAMLMRGDAQAGARALTGNLLSLIAGLFYAGFFLATQRARAELSAFVSWWLSASASAVALLLTAISLRQPLTGYAATTYFWILCVALATQVGGYLFVNYALGHLPATIVSPTLLLQPVLTAIIAVPLLGERVGLMQAVGSGGVMFGVWLVNRYGK